MTTKRSNWLLVERLENWEVDSREGFVQFGVPDRRATLANQIATGDLLFFYVSSGISKFADIREATADGTQKLSMGGSYSTAFPWKLTTRPYLTLEKEDWVPFRDLQSRLSISNGKADWRQVMRNSVRRLSQDDAALILKRMQKGQRKGNE